MDRIALALVATGLVIILSTVVSVLGGSAGAMADLTAPGAALGGATIVGGLAMLERRAFVAARHTPGRALSA